MGWRACRTLCREPLGTGRMQQRSEKSPRNAMHDPTPFRAAFHHAAPHRCIHWPHTLIAQRPGPALVEIHHLCSMHPSMLNAPQPRLLAAKPNFATPDVSVHKLCMVGKAGVGNAGTCFGLRVVKAEERSSPSSLRPRLPHDALGLEAGVPMNHAVPLVALMLMSWFTRRSPASCASGQVPSTSASLPEQLGH